MITKVMISSSSVIKLLLAKNCPDGSFMISIIQGVNYILIYKTYVINHAKNELHFKEITNCIPSTVVFLLNVSTKEDIFSRNQTETVYKFLYTQHNIFNIFMMTFMW